MDCYDHKHYVIEPKPLPPLPDEGEAIPLRSLPDSDLKQRNDENALINRSPNELLSLIFMRCLPDNAFAMLSCATLDPYYQPLIINHVCARGREVAVHLPAFWRRLALGPCKARRHGQTHLGSLCFERARVLKVMLYYSDLLYAHAQCDCVLDLVVRNLGRIGVVDLCLTEASMLKWSLTPKDRSPSSIFLHSGGIMISWALWRACIIQCILPHPYIERAELSHVYISTSTFR